MPRAPPLHRPIPTHAHASTAPDHESSQSACFAEKNVPLSRHEWRQIPIVVNAWERRKRCKDTLGNLSLEAFRVKARAGESRQHLEASLALGEVTNPARRRQRVSKPCHRAPKVKLAGSLRREWSGGRAGTSLWQEIPVPPGSREDVQRDTGGFPRNVGDPVVSTHPDGGYRETQSPIHKSTWYRPAKETKCGETGGGRS